MHKLDKVFIYPHNGSMAMYPEPMPTKEDYFDKGDCMSENYFTKTVYQTDMANWQQSRIGYIKEPEFKEKQEVYYNSILVTITCKREDNKWLVCDRSNPIRHESFLVDEEDISHYQPGQKVNFKDFRWVKKLGLTNQEEEERQRLMIEQAGIRPMMQDDFDRLIHLHKKLLKGQDPHKQKVQKWQPVEEPAMYGYTDFEETTGINANWEKEHAKFQAKTKSGAVMLEEI